MPPSATMPCSPPAASLLGLAAADKRIGTARPNGLDDNPQYKLDIDPEKASALGVSLADVNTTLSSAWGSSYVNDFIDRGPGCEKSLPPGRCAFPHAAGRRQPLVCAQQRRRDGAFLQFLDWLLDQGLAQARTLQRRARRRHRGRTGSGLQFGPGHAGHDRSRRQAARRHRSPMGGPLL